ncbi:MAG: hypothetical protein Q7S76_00955 [bacterium]|nr:hypothetical protein [bacterium]
MSTPSSAPFSIFERFIKTLSEYCQFSLDQKRQFTSDSVLNVLSDIVGKLEKTSQEKDKKLLDQIKSSTDVNEVFSLLQVLFQNARSQATLPRIGTDAFREYCVYILAKTEHLLSTAQKEEIQRIIDSFSHDAIVSEHL